MTDEKMNELMQTAGTMAREYLMEQGVPEKLIVIRLKVGYLADDGSCILFSLNGKFSNDDDEDLIDA
jgi:hypothetical protein